jgi:lipid-A-disaccharide synthase
VLLLAGEASGDEHGAALAAAIRGRRADLRFVGMGGPLMAAEGVELLAGLADLAVMGFAEVLPRIPFFWRLERKIVSLLDDPAVELVILIDYPGFNMRIARAASRRGRLVLYYIAPQVWAWRPGRARALAEWTDRVAVILPFEADFLARSGVRTEYVGHPLLDRPEESEEGGSFCERWGLDPERPVLALLPGSRQQEIARHLDLFVRTAERVCATLPDVQPVISRAPGLPHGLITEQALPVVDDTRGLLSVARAALVKSGTATLEAAIEGTPTVVAYRTSALTWSVAKALVRTEHVALPSLIAAARIVPEYLQSDATPEQLARDLIPLLGSDSPEREAQLAGFATVRAALGSPGAAGRVADVAMELIGMEK